MTFIQAALLSSVYNPCVWCKLSEDEQYYNLRQLFFVMACSVPPRSQAKWAVPISHPILAYSLLKILMLLAIDKGRLQKKMISSLPLDCASPQVLILGVSGCSRCHYQYSPGHYYSNSRISIPDP